MSARQLWPLDFEMVREQYPDRWERADAANADVEAEVDLGAYRVELSDGGEHDVVFKERDEEYVGHCDCEGFTFHTTGGKGPCAHLCALAKLSVLNEIRVPDADGEADESVAVTNGADAEVESSEPADAVEPPGGLSSGRMDKVTFRTPEPLKAAGERRADRLGFPNFSEYLRHLMRQDVSLGDFEAATTKHDNPSGGQP